MSLNYIVSSCKSSESTYVDAVLLLFEITALLALSYWYLIIYYPSANASPANNLSLLPLQKVPVSTEETEFMPSIASDSSQLASALVDSGPTSFHMRHYGHVDIQLQNTPQDPITKTLSLLVTAGNELRIDYLPGIEFDRTEQFELEMFDLEKSIMDRLLAIQTASTSTSTDDIPEPKAMRTMLILDLIRFRSIYHGCEANPRYKSLLVEYCYRLIMSPLFMQAIGLETVGMSMVPFVVDSVFFLGPQIDMAFPGIISRTAQLANVIISQNYLATQLPKLEPVQPIECLWTLCITQSSSPSVLDMLPRLFLAIIQDASVDDHIKTVLANLTGLLVLAKHKRLGSAHHQSISALAQYTLEYPNSLVRTAMAFSFWKYEHYFPLQASYIMAEIPEQYRKELDSTKSIAFVDQTPEVSENLRVHNE